jgi:arsenate reductase-like glutaredoxin family protein
MMQTETITLEIPESQLVEWVQRLSPSVKQSVLRAQIPEMDALEQLLQYGDERIRDVAARRGMDWDSLNEQQRENLINDILHEA